MSHISNFKKGDRIVRMKRSHSGDRSYLGDEVVFVGIANNRIYVMKNEKFFGVNMRDLSLENWCDDWEYYSNPNKFLDGELLELFDIKVIEKYIRSKKIKKINR